MEIPCPGGVAGRLLIVFQQERSALEQQPARPARAEGRKLGKLLQGFAQRLLGEFGVDLQASLILTHIDLRDPA